ncbi:MAG: RNA polymerase sigma factor [Marinibacterium profundimaris]|jgi:RNA polymerase sigma-70 factor (ECF subfamily)
MSLDNWFIETILPLEGALDRFLRRNWRNESEVPDLRQEVYARVFRAAQSGGLPEHPKALVFTTARNLIIDRIRRQQVVHIESVMDIEALNVALDEAGPLEQLTGRAELRRLQAELDRMPERTRDVVVLRKIHGLSQKETAAQLGVSEPTVERHVAAGMRRLANALQRENRSGRSRKQPDARERTPGRGH